VSNLPKTFRPQFAFSKQLRRQPDRQRASAQQRGYTSGWNDYSHWFRSQPENICCACGCGELSKEVDHIIPAEPNDPRFWDTANHQALAHNCHNRKTLRFNRGHGRNPDNSPAGQAALRRMLRLAGYRARLIRRRESGLPRMRPHPNRFIICGPPASGKTTWLRKHAIPGAIQWDLDAVALTLGIHREQRTPELTGVLITMRQAIEQMLATDPGPAAYLIISDLQEANLLAGLIGAQVVQPATPSGPYKDGGIASPGMARPYADGGIAAPGVAKIPV